LIKFGYLFFIPDFPDHLNKPFVYLKGAKKILHLGNNFKELVIRVDKRNDPEDYRINFRRGGIRMWDSETRTKVDEIIALTRDLIVLVSDTENDDKMTVKLRRRDTLIHSLDSLENIEDSPEDEKRARLLEALNTELMNTTKSAMEEINGQRQKLRNGKTVFKGYEKITQDPGSTYFDKKK
jgi:hypothetical protein